VTAGPICIGGLDRSGKTTLAAFLTSHPNIAIPPVGSNMWTYFRGRFGRLDIAENLERCLAAMLRYEHVRVLEPDLAWVRRTFDAGPATYPRLFAAFHEDYARRQGKARWGEQTGRVERYADEIFATFPAARFVHMVRDPRDRYAASLEHWPDGRGRAGGATARWCTSTRLAERHRRRYPGRYLVVRYEDLVTHPGETVRAVCEFLDEEYVPAMLAMPGAPDRRDRLAARSSLPPSSCPLTTEYIGRYRSVVPPHEIAFVQMHARRLMRRYGYGAQPGALRGTGSARFVLDWPNQAARMVAWRAREAAERWWPAVAGRNPDSRTLVEASA